MTVTAAEARKEYAGNGVVTSFSYPSQFYQSNDLEVWLFDNATEVGALQVIGTDYTVTGVMNPTGGTVDFTVAPPAGTTVIIINSPDITQLTHYINADDFPADSHEQALDRLTKIAQRLDDKISRTIRSPDWTPEEDVPDAETLVGLVQDAEDAAANSANSASAAAASANAAQASQTAAANSAFVASGHVVSAEEAAADAETSAAAAAASAAAAEVAKIEWQGAWNSGTAYAPNDAVQVGGSSYISKTSNTNKNPPSNPADWDLMAQKGADSSGGGGGGGDMLSANNLSDVASVPTSRANLGLGNSATRNVGAAANTVAAGDDARFASLQSQITANDGDIATLASDLATKAPTASPAFSGNPTAPTPSPGDSDTSIATTAFVQAALAASGLAPIANPVFTGNPQAPTPTAGDNDTSLATTAFVKAAIDVAMASASTPLKLQIDHVQNEHLTLMSGYNIVQGGYYAVMKDGSVRFWGGGSTIPFPAGAVPWGSLPGLKVNLPAGLTGTPAKIVQGGREVFIITTTGDCCCMGVNANGELGLNDLVARTTFTLLDATNIGPRSPGGSSRAIVEICMSGSNYTTSTPLTTMIRCADGTLWASGANGNGQCADGTAVRRQTFGQCKKEGSAAIADCAKVIISGGQSSSAMYIDTSGKVRCCGNMSAGNGRNSVATANQNLFLPIFTSTDNALSDLPPTYQALEVNWCGATGLLRCADKCLYGFGYNAHAQIGDNTTTAKANPTKCGKGTANAAALNGTIERFLIGNAVDNQTFGVYAQVTDGSLFVWGYGNASNIPAPNVAATQPTRPNVWGSTPQPNIMRIFSWMTAAASAATQYAMLFADGTMWTWGGNNLNDNTASINPAQIPRPLGMPTIVDGYGAAVGQYTTFFVKLADGTWRAWGALVGPAAGFSDNTFTLFGAYGFFHFGFPNCPSE